MWIIKPFYYITERNEVIILCISPMLKQWRWERFYVISCDRQVDRWGRRHWIRNHSATPVRAQIPTKRLRKQPLQTAKSLRGKLREASSCLQTLRRGRLVETTFPNLWWSAVKMTSWNVSLTQRLLSCSPVYLRIFGLMCDFLRLYLCLSTHVLPGRSYDPHQYCSDLCKIQLYFMFDFMLPWLLWKTWKYL